MQSGSSEPPPGEAPAQPDSVKPHLSLSRAIELALAQSPGLDAMHWQSQALWEQAESVLGHGRLKSSFSILGLQTTAPLGVFASKLSQGSVSQADFNPAVLNDPDPYGNIEYQLRLVYPLFSSERIELLASALRLNAEAVSLDRIRAEHELEGRVIETYLAHDLLEEQLAVLDDTRLTIAALTRSIESLHREGLVIGADLAAAQVEASKLEDELNKAGAQLAMTENLIAILTGADPGFSSELDLSTLEPGLPELEELYQTALESRPDLRAMQSRVAAAGAMLEEATRKRRPEIGAFAEGKHSTPDLPGNGHTELTVGAQLSIDLDTGGVLKNEVQQKRSELNAARKGLEQLEQMAKMDVAVAWSELDSALGSRESLRSQSDKAAENLRVVTNRYREGLTNYLDVRMAVSSHKESRLRSLQADYDAALAYMRLLSACGRIGSADDPFLGGLVSAAPEEAAVLDLGGAEVQQAQSTGMQQWGEN
ncbi:TolC family protein [bacterium]|nr:TolC family protein [bacterium]